MTNVYDIGVCVREKGEGVVIMIRISKTCETLTHFFNKTFTQF